MTFSEALKKLDIEDYGERIVHSNSHGELFHCVDYILLAQMDNVSWFRAWFETVVRWAENNWDRPESIFQHIPRCLQDRGRGILRTSRTPH